MDLTELDINFLFVSDRVIRKYNRRYLHHDCPTDVIAFEMGEKKMLGDILISSDRAKRQAREMGHPLLTEAKILSLHGVLHLLGYRDKNERDRKKMWKKTDELLKSVKDLR